MNIERVTVSLAYQDISILAQGLENSLSDVIRRNIEYYDTFDKFKRYNDNETRLCKEFFLMAGSDWSAMRLATRLEDQWRFLRTQYEASLKAKSKKSKKRSK
jgi:hypothetical protein